MQNIDAAWVIIQQWFKKHCQEYLDDILVKQNATQVFATIEKEIGVSLPAEFKYFYTLQRGQTNIELYGLIFGIQLMTAEDLMEVWQASFELEDMNEDVSLFSSIPEGYIKPLYINHKWIPFALDSNYNYLGIDLDPDTKGQSGQVIIFGRDEDEKKLVAHSFAEFLQLFAEQLTKYGKVNQEDKFIMYDDGQEEVHYFDMYSAENRQPRLKLPL